MRHPYIFILIASWPHARMRSIDISLTATFINHHTTTYTPLISDQIQLVLTVVLYVALHSATLVTMLMSTDLSLNTVTLVQPILW